MADVTGRGKPVALTGASGFVGSHLLKLLLERGYSVRATVRDASNEANVAWIKNLAKDTPGTLELFSADLMKPGSFDAALEGCEVVFHTAAVAAFKVKDPVKDIIEPNVEGTRNVLQSVIKHRTARRVVATSSEAAITDHLSDSTHVHTEADWNNDPSIKNAYPTAKSQAERLAWQMYEEVKAAAAAAAEASEGGGGDGATLDGWSFELVTICPSAVLGPILHKQHARTSPQAVLQMMDGSLPLIPDLFFLLVDVRDVVLAHVLAAERVEAKGRYIVTSDDDPWSMTQMAETLRKEFPKQKIPTRPMPHLLAYVVALFNPAVTFDFLKRRLGRIQRISNAKSKAELGIEYHKPEEALIETARSLIDSGIVKRL